MCGRGGKREREREIERKSTARGRGRERECFGSSFYMFSSTWAHTMQMGLSQECCLFCLKSSLWSSELPLTFLVFFLATAILDSFPLFYLPNIMMPESRKRESEKSCLKTQHAKDKNHGIWSHHFMTNRGRKQGNSDRLS